MANYLYNGVELPELPSGYDDYPYAVIKFLDSEYGYQLNLSNLPFYADAAEDGSLSVFHNPKGHETIQFWGFLVRNNEWTLRWSWIQTLRPGYVTSCDTFLWTGYDIYSATNTSQVLAQATKPVSVLLANIDTTSMTLGWLVGRRIASQRRKRVIVAYLYNDVELPPLPEWDKETYPYAAIYKHPVSGAIYFVGEDSKETVSVENTVILFQSDRLYKYENGEWVHQSSGAFNVMPIWANHDVYYAEDLADIGGTLFLAASEPLPIYE